MFTLLHKARFFTSSLFVLLCRCRYRHEPMNGHGSQLWIRAGRRRAHQLFDAGFSQTRTERAVLTQLDQKFNYTALLLGI